MEEIPLDFGDAAAECEPRQDHIIDLQPVSQSVAVAAPVLSSTSTTATTTTTLLPSCTGEKAKSKCFLGGWLINRCRGKYAGVPQRSVERACVASANQFRDPLFMVECCCYFDQEMYMHPNDRMNLTSDEVVNHARDLYVKQDGKCALTGVKFDMTSGKRHDSVAITCVSGGVEGSVWTIGNLMLVTSAVKKITK
jgi:hypothetical protein